MIQQCGTLVGKLKVAHNLTAKMKGLCNLTGSLTKAVGYIDYTGEYEVIPKVEQQILNTKDRHMVDDVTVKAIPYFDVGNNAGGSTVYIAKEVN